MVAERKPIRPSALVASRKLSEVLKPIEVQRVQRGRRWRPTPRGETASTPGPVPHQKVSKMPDYSELELD